jgi:hypothetical protein
MISCSGIIYGSSACNDAMAGFDIRRAATASPAEGEIPAAVTWPWRGTAIFGRAPQCRLMYPSTLDFLGFGLCKRIRDGIACAVPKRHRIPCDVRLL